MLLMVLIKQRCTGIKNWLFVPKLSSIYPKKFRSFKLPLLKLELLFSALVHPCNCIEKLMNIEKVLLNQCKLYVGYIFHLDFVNTIRVQGGTVTIQFLELNQNNIQVFNIYYAAVLGLLVVDDANR